MSRLSVLPEEHFDFKIKHEDCVGSGEKVEERVERDFWAKERCGVDQMEGYIEARFLWKSVDDEVGAQLKPMYKDLELAMGGKGSKAKIGWPPVLFMRTKERAVSVLRVSEISTFMLTRSLTSEPS